MGGKPRKVSLGLGGDGNGVEGPAVGGGGGRCRRSSEPSPQLRRVGQDQPPTPGMTLRRCFSEFGGPIWDLPDGRIIFASVICVGCGAGKGGWRAKAGKSRDRAGSFKIHACFPLCPVLGDHCLDPHRIAWHPRATLRQAVGGVPAATPVFRRRPPARLSRPGTRAQKEGLGEAMRELPPRRKKGVEGLGEKRPERAGWEG